MHLFAAYELLGDVWAPSPLISEDPTRSSVYTTVRSPNLARSFSLPDCSVVVVHKTVRLVLARYFGNSKKNTK